MVLGVRIGLKKKSLVFLSLYRWLAQFLVVDTVSLSYCLLVPYACTSCL